MEVDMCEKATVMNVNFNSCVSISTCDYYGKASCVIFFNGCNFRCKDCYNKQTWNSVNMTDIDTVKSKIESSIPFVSSVTFSGGEPYFQYDALKNLAKFSKTLGLYTAVETNGYFTKNIIKSRTKSLMNEMYVDIKAPIYDSIEYYKVTGVIDSSEKVVDTLETGFVTEIRIVDNLNVREIKKSLRKYEYPIRVLPFRRY